MQTEPIEHALRDAAQSVLETMCFTMVEGDAPSEFSTATDLVRTRMTFSGAWSGRFELKAQLASARMIAGSFTGESGDDMPVERVTEVMCELANMVCGSTLSHLARSHLASDRVFDLSSPQVLPCVVTGDPPPIGAVTAAMGLDLGDGVVAFSMSVDSTG